MKHAIVVFTKVPEAGKVKTRLTEERGGIFTAEEARAFYEACLTDMLDVCTRVEKVPVWICYNCDGNRDDLESLIMQLKHPERIAGMFKDQGGSFDECMQYAVDYLFGSAEQDKLAESLLIIGGDVCGLQVSTLNSAIEQLERISKSPAGKKAAVDSDSKHSDVGAAMVVSADQEGGFNLTGYTCTTPFDFRKVFYNMEGITALEGLAEKAKEKHIPLLPLDVVLDVDLPVDLASIIPVLNVLEQGNWYDERIIAPQRSIAFLRNMGLQSYASPIDGWH